MSLLRYAQVSKQFGPDDFALKEVSFELPSGEMVFITGPSGSGKTTLMRLLIREYAPTSGDIVFDDQSLSQLKNKYIPEHRRKIGVVFQDYKLLPELNVWENIALPLEVMGKPDSEIEQRVTDLLALIKMPEKAFLFPAQLSGGEAQRVSIARALAPSPRVIFADEPTGNLDDENSLAIAHLLTRINSLGTTILFATHDSDLLREFNEIRHLVLKNGVLIHDSYEKNKGKTDEKAEDKPEETKEASESDSQSKKDTKDDEPKKISIWQHLLNPNLKKKIKNSPTETIESLDEDSEEKNVDDNDDPDQDEESEKDKETKKTEQKKSKKNKSKPEKKPSKELKDTKGKK